MTDEIVRYLIDAVSDVSMELLDVYRLHVWLSVVKSVITGATLFMSIVVVVVLVLGFIKWMD